MSIDHEYKKLYLEMTEGIKPNRVLKTDCYNEAHLYRIAEPGNHIVEIDQNTIDVCLAREPYRDYKLIKADIRHLPYDNNSFDVILDFSTIDHIENYEEAFKEYKRTLSKNGKILVVVWTAPESKGNQITFKYNEFKRKFEQYFKLTEATFIEHHISDNPEARLSVFKGVK